MKAVKGARARRAAPKATGAVARRKLTVRSTVVRGGNVVTTTLGQPLMPSVIALVKDRFERRSREYDDARKQFEAAAEAVRSADYDDKSIKLRTNLNHFGTEMRVQAWRRAELDWLQRVLQGEGGSRATRRRCRRPRVVAQARLAVSPVDRDHVEAEGLALDRPREAAKSRAARMTRRRLPKETPSSPRRGTPRAVPSPRRRRPSPRPAR